MPIAVVNTDHLKLIDVDEKLFFKPKIPVEIYVHETVLNVCGSTLGTDEIPSISTTWRETTICHAVHCRVNKYSSD